MEQRRKPVIIYRRRATVHTTLHPSSTWKVAYADFVTAMMVFFLVMWLLGMTDEQQRKGLADYFAEQVTINRDSGGGVGNFNGDSIFTDDVLARNGAGAAMIHPTESNRASGDRETDQTIALQKTVEIALAAYSGESMTMAQTLRHVVTKVTDEGLVIELYDLPNAPLFKGDTAVPERVTQDIAGVLADVLSLAKNHIAVNGHVHSYPVTLVNNPIWDLSSARAAALRTMIQDASLPPSRFQRFAGYGDRKPATANPFADRNNRLEVILLRADR